jgi:hypothetical protein
VSYADESSLSPHEAVPGLSIPMRTLFWSRPMISIIDDDASVRAATYRLVRSLGYLADTFASAGEFLRSPQLDHTSCVIADIQMP